MGRLARVQLASVKCEFSSEKLLAKLVRMTNRFLKVEVIFIEIQNCNCQKIKICKLFVL